jgi:hypothetical protein
LTSKDDELRKKLSASTVEAAPVPMTAPLSALSATKTIEQPKTSSTKREESQVRTVRVISPLVHEHFVGLGTGRRGGGRLKLLQ